MYRHILIPTDGSDLAEHAVTNGLALAKSLGAKVSVIVVEEPFDWLSVSKSTERRDLRKFAKHAEQIKKHATSVLNRAANAAKQAGVSYDTIQVENEQPFQAIIAAAENKGCDLIVMASHGRSGLSGVLLGSVTNKVLTHRKPRYWFVTEFTGRLLGGGGLPALLARLVRFGSFAPQPVKADARTCPLLSNSACAGAGQGHRIGAHRRLTSLPPLVFRFT